MPTARLVPSSYGRSSTSRVTVTNPENMYYNTDHTSAYCTMRGRNSSSYTYYAFINGFNFADIPANATVTAFTVKIRCYRNSYQRTGDTYRLRLCSSASNSSVISGTTTSTEIGTTASVITIPTGSLTWAQLKGYGSGLSIEVVLSSGSNQYPYVYVYGAEIEVTYSVETVHVTGVTLDKATASIEVGETTTLTETVTPSNATDKSVSWSTSNSSVATVSGGVVTGVSAGSARITVTTMDGGYTAYCDITVTPATLYDFVPATTLEPGKQYLITNGNTGSVYLLSVDSAGSGALAGISAAISNGKISITGAAKAKALFDCVLQDNNDQGSTVLMTGSDYLYTDSSSRLRIASYTSSMAGKHWHYKGENKCLLWFFKDGTDNDGYTDTSSTYKYYLSCSSGTWTDLYVSTTSLAETTTPEVYLWVESDGVPVITVGTPSQSAISAITGHDQCVCTFTSDLALSQWEARATKAGVIPARGVGLLVESGTTLAANTPATIYVENEELTQGDGEYTITVYGQSVDGIWSA